jgi:hypothetical protein
MNMANVFANGNEVSAKKDGNKAICAMPDVCLSPPSPPAGPIPIPYPNSSDASRTTDGSKTVKIGGEEVGLKNSSTWKDSNGDEAATKSLGMNVISHNIQGPLKHAAWSMDVKIEGYNAIRHMDMTTQNHMNPGGVVGIDLGKMAPPSGDAECVELENAARDAAKNDTPSNDLPGNTALVTAKHSGSGKIMKAIAPGDAVKSSAQSGYEQPANKSTVTCTNKPYNPNTQGNKDHAESKILESLFKGGSPGGAVTMRINWNNNGQHAQRPCSQCMGTICETAKACGIQINICVSNFDGSMTKKPAPCKTVNHRDGTQSHKWETNRMFR